jgi:hypothetical protein
MSAARQRRAQSTFSDRRVLPPRLRRLIEGELKPDEMILWLAQPDPKRFGRSAWRITVAMILWTLCMAAFTAFCYSRRPNLPTDFMYFCIAMLSLGVILAATPIWKTYWARSFAYVVTDQRAYIFNCHRIFYDVHIRAYALERLRDIECVEQDGGWGDLIFECQVSVDSDGDETETVIGFFAIPEVQRVRELLRQLANEVSRDSEKERN